MSQSSSSAPNLFSIATSELSQDAFLTWLMQWADPSHQQANPQLHQAGKSFIKNLISLQAEAPEKITKVKAGRQWKNIDVWAEVNDEYLIIIEDKVGTGRHSNQLERYQAIGQQWCDEHNAQLVCIYLKTHSESLASLQTVRDNGYAVFGRQDFLDLLGRHQVKNDIYNDFESSLKLLEESESQYSKKHHNDWEWADWTGFYQALDKAGALKNWYYVANQTGGFLDGIVGGADHLGHPCFLQIEQGALCFKIGEVYENRSGFRNQVHQLLSTNSLDDLPVYRPARFGCGAYMTVAQVPQSDWIQTKDGLLDLEATVTILQRYKSWLIEIISSTEAS